MGPGRGFYTSVFIKSQSISFGKSTPKNPLCASGHNIVHTNASTTMGEMWSISRGIENQAYTKQGKK
jgi:hypothetical protein